MAGDVALKTSSIEVLVSSRGGRVRRLRDLRTGVDWLLRTPRNQSVDPGSSRWEDHPRCGWDEMFPGIEAATSGSRPIPDHGELWSEPWSLRREGNELSASFSSRHGYRFTRTLEVRGRRIEVSYVLSATGSGQSYLWAAHPLMPGDVDVSGALSAGTPLVTEYCSDPGLPRGTELEWGSVAPGTRWQVGQPHPGFAVKAFAATPRLVALSRGRSRLSYEFDPVTTPWLGLWLNYGGWPSEDGDRHIAIEPATAPTDSLARAVSSGAARSLLQDETHRWGFTITFEDA